MLRKTCIFCQSADVRTIEKVTNFPIYMGATNKNEFLFKDLIYGKCQNCKGVQLLDLVELSDLYEDNHNISTVGDLWKQHFLEFGKFVLSTGKPKDVLEIGDPSFKLKKVLLESDNWVLAQPNIDPSLTLPKKVTYINSFVGEGFSKHFKTKKVDTIIMSHVFEHLYEPVGILKELKKCLNDDGAIFVSIPNFSHISQNDLMPPLGLHFEHTFFCDKDKAMLIFNKSGFQVEQILNFKSHSVFFQIKKKKTNDHQKRLNNLLDHYRKLVEKWNDSPDRFYLYGAHFPAQLLLSAGLNQDKIISILDNAEDKHGKKLYGTDLKVEPLSAIKRAEKPLVLCEMGLYTDEIKEQLKECNENVSF